MAKEKIDLFPMLKAVDQGDTEFYNRLSAEQKKSFSAWTTMIWASAIANKKEAPYYLEMVNEYVNKNMTTLSKHPELLWKLTTIVGIGDSHKHEWPGSPQSKKKNKIQEFLSQIYPGMNMRDLEMLEQINTKADLRELARQHNYTEKEIKEFIK